jgi:hypothetical protein
MRKPFGADEIEDLLGRRLAFNQRVGALFNQSDFLLLPAAPISRLQNGAGHAVNGR